MKTLARMRTPTEIFRIRNSQLNRNQHAEFALELLNTKESYKNSTQMTLDNFQLKIYPSHNAHLIIVKQLNPLEEIELHIQMKIFTNDILYSVSIMKLLIYVSQYDFYP